MKTLNEVMTKNIITVSPDTSLPELLNLMKEKKVGKLPVLENEEIIGVVTRDDLLIKKETAPAMPILAINDLLLTLPSSKFFKQKLEKITGYQAKELMRTDLLRVNKDTHLDKVVSDIIEKNYEFALVFENNKLIGLITKTNLIESF